MQSVNPWIGVVVIILAIGAAVAFTLLKIPQAGIPTALIGIAVSILTGQQHAEARKELARVKAQLAVFKGPEMKAPEQT